MQTYQKTAAGKSEIATRSGQVSPRLRSLLVMIDGKRKTEELLALWSVLGYGPESFEQLMQLGMIEAANEGQTYTEETASESEVHKVEEGPASNDQEFGAESKSKVEQAQLLYSFYCDTIRELIGLRGFFLQLRVERAGSIEDYRALREDYLQLVTKTKGDQASRAIANQLDQLLI